ncbi:MAG TPA: DUF4279 domain-containing protein [Terriglobales bacterium]|nr:DUF4279 domain-containing protein [Terriglobales bacterium]
MSEENKFYAYFTVTGSFDPEYITKRVGISPTDSWRVGDLNPRNSLERKFSRWSLYSRLAKSESLEAHIADVLDQLDASAAAFKEVSINESGGMQLVAQIYSEYPGLHFEREIIQRLGEYRLSVDCDFYYLYSDAREDTR